MQAITKSFCCLVGIWINEQYAKWLVVDTVHFPLQTTDKETMKLLVIWDGIMLTRRHCNEWIPSWSIEK